VPEELQDRVDYLLCKIADTAKRSVDGIFAQLGIRGSHHAVLRVLAASGPLSQHGIAQRLHVDSSTIVDLVDQLEKRGLATRRRSPTDRRVQLVAMADEGQAVLAAGDGLAASLREQVFSRLTAQDYEHLHRTLIGLIMPAAGQQPG
jgi:DNA-binding MarR family transcriptional regulator